MMLNVSMNLLVCIRNLKPRSEVLNHLEVDNWEDANKKTQILYEDEILIVHNIRKRHK